MYYDQRANESRLERTRRLGLPDGAGSSMLMEGDGTGAYHGAIRQRFGDILSGSLKPKLNDMDEHNSSLFMAMAPTRINTGDEFGNGGRGAAAISSRNHFPTNDRRNMRPRGPQVPKVSDSKHAVAVESFDVPSKVDGISDLSQVEALFNGGRTSRGGDYAPTGPLLPERGLDTSMDMGGYGAGVPFDPINQIRSKITSRTRSGGVDYRDIESSRSYDDMGESEDRYLNGLANRGQRQSGNDAQIIQEMARNIAEQNQMIRSLMNDNKGKRYFKEINTTHQFENPKSKLVEIDGKYYRMELTQVKFKKGKSSDK